MRVAIITPGFSAHPTDWAIPALLNLARCLAQSHEIHVFSQRYPARGVYQFDSLTHHALGGGQQFGLASAKIWLQSYQAVVRQHHHTPFDVIHAFWADEAGLSAVLAGAKLKRPVVVSLGGGELTHLPQINYGAQRFLIRRWTTRYALTKAAVVTAGSQYQLDLCRAHHLPTHKLHLAPLGVDTHLFHPPILPSLHPLTPSPSHPPTLIQVASLLPVKNQTLLLEILALVKKEIPHIQLNMAGAGPLQHELVSLAKNLEVDQSIIWRQQVPYPDLVHLYQASRLYLQTSYHESQGMAVLEAMACGLPVLGTPVGVVREIACLPPQTSKEALAAQVIDILNDPVRYQELSRQARQISLEKFSLPIVTKNFLNIYNKISNN